MCLKVENLKKMIAECNNIVFFGGAGVSTESGIPDFRSKDGLYNQKFKYPPEIILGYKFFVQNPDEFFKFYKEKMNTLNVEPNITHYSLAKLENIGKLKCVITQNIDGLHQKAGSKNVVELHGSVHRNYCVRCRRKYGAKQVFSARGIPKCKCEGIIKPDVTLYGESLNKVAVNNAIDAIEKADLLIIGGTSLTVFPACSYISFFKGKYLVIINKDTTEYDSRANLIINKSLGEVFNEIIKDY